MYCKVESGCDMKIISITDNSVHNKKVGNMVIYQNSIILQFIYNDEIVVIDKESGDIKYSLCKGTGNRNIYIYDFYVIDGMIRFLSYYDNEMLYIKDNGIVIMKFSINSDNYLKNMVRKDKPVYEHYRGDLNNYIGIISNQM